MKAVTYIEEPNPTPENKALRAKPFKPEMIMMFKGWSETINESDSYSNYECNYQVDLIDYAILNNDKWHWFTCLPPTIDQFISDCQRAGIALEWKKKIVEKYFK